MKKYLIILFLFLMMGSCSTTSKNPFYQKKYHTETKKSYKTKRGLMLLENSQLGRNKALYSKQNQKTKRTTYKKYHKK